MGTFGRIYNTALVLSAVNTLPSEGLLNFENEKVISLYQGIRHIEKSRDG